jgi:2-polyprenyl-6-methoxyphenol hydroxylase-like FAD-dependent oxidoreductase
MDTPTSQYDVVVIGGGPAGSTVSTLIADAGLSVGLFERERFPRFHIGESLIPETYWVLKRLGMLEKMQRSHFVKKYSVQFVNANGKLSAPFYFWDNKPHECSQTWQVVRSEFDKMMLDNAREHGVDAHEGVHVLEVLFEGERAVGVRVKDAEGVRRDVLARVVVDASGQAALLQNRFKLRLWDPVLNKGAIWTYWEGAYRDTGRDEGATMVLQTPDRQGWFWYIPLHDNIVSVGVVAPFDYLFKGRSSHEQTYQEEVERCPAVKQRLAGAKAGDWLLPDPRLFVPLDDGGRRRLGAGRRRVWISRPAVFVGSAARAEVGRARRRCDRRRPPRRRTPAARALARGARTSTPASTGCEGWCASTTTGSASATSSATTPSCAARSPIFSSATSSAIGWTRSGGRWSRSTSLERRRFPPGVPERPPDAIPDKANELVLPEGRRP